MGGVRSHECCFNEFKVLVLDVDAGLMALRLLVCAPSDKRHFVQIKVGARLI